MEFRLPNGLEQLVLATFFGLISKHLPPAIAWVPCLCWVFTVLASLWPHLLFQKRVMHHLHYLEEDNAPELERPGRRMMNLNPNYELIKALLGHVIVAIAVLTILYNHSIPSAVSSVLISASVGFAAIWVVLLIRDTLPGFASRIGQLGVAFGLASLWMLLIQRH